jgi:hypothetical protein
MTAADVFFARDAAAPDASQDAHHSVDSDRARSVLAQG